MKQYSWPGNMRELRRVIQEAVVRSEQSVEITLDHVPVVISKKARRSLAPMQGATLDDSQLPKDAAQWPRERLLSELSMAVAAKRHVQAYKGTQWKAEFMRLMYPECKAANAKGFQDLMRRLTKGPWGSAALANDADGRTMIQELQEP